jgi:hypothetical protein
MRTKNLRITLPMKTLDIINKDFDYIGNNESERIQNIIISTIFLKNHFIKRDKNEILYIKDNINVIEDVLSTIIDLHVIDECKNIKTHDENIIN